MTQLWQLKKISTNQPLNEPQPLPENWGPIFGLAGIADKLSDLSWLGEGFSDQGWFVVGEEPETPQPNQSEVVLTTAKQLLSDSDWTMLQDVPMTKEQKIAWMDYRKSLREINLQIGFPNNVQWPVAPL